MKPQLKITIGISGSGKSTWATEFISKNDNWVRLNRDDARRQLLGKLTPDYYTSKRVHKTEKHVTNILDDQIRYFLNAGVNVIVDNTHLSEKYLRHYEDSFGHLAYVSFKIFDTPLSVAQDRVSIRENGATVEYIKKQAQDFLKMKPREAVDRITQLGVYNDEKYNHRSNRFSNQRPKCIIVDIDGTVADCTGVRDPYDGKKCHMDTVIEPVKLLLKRFHGNWLTRLISPIKIIYVSGREEKWIYATIAWLKANKLPFDGMIYMRQTGDMRNDSIVKEEIYTAHIERYYHTQFVLDDRLSVCHNWFKLGLFVCNVNQGLKHF